MSRIFILHNNNNNKAEKLFEKLKFQVTWRRTTIVSLDKLVKKNCLKNISKVFFFSVQMRFFSKI